MASHVGVSVIPADKLNAINVVYALIAGEDPSLSGNISQPASANGSNPPTHYFGGRTYTVEELAIYQDIANNMPSTSWPVAGIDGSVTESAAIAAVAALVITVTTRESYTTQQSQETLAAALSALGLERISED